MDLGIPLRPRASARREPFVVFLGTGRPGTVTAVRQALDGAGIPFRSGLLQGPPPQVIFYVPRRRLREAHSLVEHYLDDGDLWNPEDEDDDGAPSPERPEADAPAAFPAGAIALCAAVAAVNVLVVGLWVRGPLEPGYMLLREGGLLQGAIALEPWRLLTALWLHADFAHAGWNALGMTVFGVPLIGLLGPWRASALYLAAGIGGGLAAMALAAPGTLVVGSSGAVAGLFGAWVSLRWRDALRDTTGWRERVRTLGVALLVLPSLVNPVAADGGRISVSSHVGGMLTGMAVGWVLYRTWATRRRRA